MRWCDNSILQCIGLPSQAQQATALLLLRLDLILKLNPKVMIISCFTKARKCVEWNFHLWIFHHLVNIPDAFLWQVLPQVTVQHSGQTARHCHRLWQSEECQCPTSSQWELNCLMCPVCTSCVLLTSGDQDPWPIRDEDGYWPLDWPGAPIGHWSGHQGPCPEWGGDIIWPIPAHFRNEFQNTRRHIVR